MFHLLICSAALSINPKVIDVSQTIPVSVQQRAAPSTEQELTEARREIKELKSELTTLTKQIQQLMLLMQQKQQGVGKPPPLPPRPLPPIPDYDKMSPYDKYIALQTRPNIEDILLASQANDHYNYARYAAKQKAIWSLMEEHFGWAQTGTVWCRPYPVYGRVSGEFLYMENKRTRTWEEAGRPHLELQGDTIRKGKAKFSVNYVDNGSWIYDKWGN